MAENSSKVHNDKPTLIQTENVSPKAPNWDISCLERAKKCKVVSFISKEYTFRFSGLPKDVIGVVLSNLTTKQAVQTSILSRDFRYTWQSISKVLLHIETAEIATSESVKILMDTVIGKGTREFRLLMRKLDLSNMLVGWLQRLMESSRLEVLEIHADSLADFYFLPSHLYLRELHLHCYAKPFQRTIPMKTTFINLKMMSLKNVQGNIDTELPKLQTCTMLWCGWPNELIVQIKAPVLKEFKCYDDRVNTDIPYTFKLIGRHYICMILGEYCATNYDFTQSVMGYVSLRFDYETEDNLVATRLKELFCQLFSAQHLEINHYITMVLGNIPFDYPSFIPQWRSLRIVKSEYMPYSPFKHLMALAGLLVIGIHVTDCSFDVEMDSDDRSYDSQEDINKFHRWLKTNGGLTNLKKVKLTLTGFINKVGPLKLAKYFLATVKMEELILIVLDLADVHIRRMIEMLV